MTPLLALVTSLVLAEPSAPSPPPEPTHAEAGADAGVDKCLALLRSGNRDDAAACYRARSAGDDEDARIARDLADVVASLRLAEPGPLQAPAAVDQSVHQAVPGGTIAFGDLVSSGKAELLATSTLTGGYVATLGMFALLQASNITDGTVGGALMLAAPVAGGVAGLGLSAAAVLLLPKITAGDANAMRSFELLGSFDSVMLLADSAPNGFGSAGTPMAMLGTTVGITAIGAVIAGVTDLPEAAGSLAVSGALWTSVLALLAAEMGDAFKLDARGAPWVITVAANAGFVGGLVVAPLVPMTRAETWALDVGGGVGLATGAAVAVFAHAPNPFIGWGTMLVGTSVGMASGFAAARWLPGALATLPELVAVAPLALPPIGASKQVVVGGALVGRF